MKHKYLLIFICLTVCLFSIASVCAGDVNECLQTNENSNDGLIENQYDDEIYVINNAENQTILKGNENTATFNDLYNLIESASEGSILELDKDYINTGNFNYIAINKQITIDGKGHTIDANHLSRIFYVKSSGVTLKNINFINGVYDSNGGAILFKSGLTSTIVDSNFTNCSAQFGGALYFDSDSNAVITNSNFINCSGEFGGALYLDTNVNSTITNSNFEYNVAEILGGSLLAGGNGYISIMKSNFTKSIAKSESGGAITFLNTNFNAQYVEFNECISEFGGAITLLSSKSNITHSTFRRNNATYDGGAIFARYGTIYLADNIFSKNCANRGGGVHIAKTTTSILNNQFAENSASNGGAVYSITSTDKVISGNTFVNNHGSPEANYYSTDNSNLTITSDDYYQFKYNAADYTVLPDFYSLVADKYVTPVKDQGVEGNCWAFAALATLESCMLKASNLTFDLSEANLKNLMAYYSDYGYMIAVNDGGHPEMVYGYLASWLGPIWDSDDPYYTNDFLSPLLKSILHVQNIVFLKREDYTDNDDIKNAILNYGAVCTSMHYDDYYLKNSIAYYYSGSYSSDHAVCIVGWDDNYSKNNFKNTPSGDGAWIVRNSWGPSWGDEGYFYVSYYDTQLAKVNTTDSYTFILNDTVRYNRIYQHEIQRTAVQTIYADEICFKNVFNVEGDEYLAAVSTYFEEECDYKISILVNDLLVSTKAGKASVGYYTIDLDDLIYLNKNDIVSVIFNFTNLKSGTGNVPCCTKSKCTNLFLERGLSFYWNNVEWVDFYSSNCVACIKMFTTFSPDHKLNPYFQVTSECDSYDNSFLISVMLPDDATGFVLLNCDNKEYIIDLSTSKSIKLYGLDENNNTLQVKYSGDDKYLDKTITYVVDISKTGTFEELSSKIINFVDDELNLTKDYYYDLGSTDGIDISKTIIINGQGHYIDAKNLSKIFNVYAKNVILKNIKFIGAYESAVEIYGSDCSLINCTFIDNYASGSAGAIYWGGENGILTGCSFENNTASYGGAVYWTGKFGKIDECTFTNNYVNNSNNGGALYWVGENGTLINSNFTENAAFHGGAVLWNAEFGKIINCLFTNNSAGFSGAAIYVNALGDALYDCTFIDNHAQYGGAICLQGSNGYLNNCSFINNGASDYGGAIYLPGVKSILEKCSFENNSAQYGGAILLQGDEGKLSLCSFVDNSALKYGGAIYWMGAGSLYDCDFSANFAQEFGGAILWDGDNGILINSTFDDNFANNYGSAVYWYGSDGSLINSTFINTLKVNQIYFYDETGTIAGCKFLNTTLGNVVYKGDNFIKRSIDLTGNDYSFSYNSPEIISISINNILNDLPILTPVTVKLSKDGETKSFNISAVDNTATLYDELFNLTVGIWKVEATFAGDDNYYCDDTSFNINITPAYSFTNLTMDTTTRLTAYITDSNNRPIDEGKVIFFDGETKIAQINVNEGVAGLSYTPTTAGKHIITAVFTADNYLSSNDTLNVTIDKPIPEIVFDEVITVEYSKPTTFTVTILSGDKLVKEGVVKFYVDDVEVKSVVNDKGVITFDYIVKSAGSHNITAIFEESDSYLSTMNSLNFSVDKLQTSIVILNDVTWWEVSNVNYGDDYCTPKLGVYTSDVILPDNGSPVPVYEKLTNYIAYFNGSADNVIVNSDGSFYLRNLTVGTYTLFVELNDSNRKGSASFTFTIDKGYASLSIPEITIGYGEYGNSTAITRAASVELGECEPYVMSNKDKYKDYIRIDGHLITVLPGLEAGTHYIDFIIKDDNWQSSETCKFKVTVLPQDTAFSSINDITILYGTDSITVNGNVNGIKYSNYAGNVNVVIGNVNANADVNGDGSFSVKVSRINTLNVGNYNAIVSGQSSSKNYNSPKDTTFALTVNPSDSIISDIVISDFEYGAAGIVNVKYSGALGISAYVLNHDEANIKINNNVISISNLGLGSYVLNVSTIVDGNHNGVSKVASFKVNKASVDIQFSNIEPVSYKNPSTIAVSILSNSNLVKEGVVKFYISGVEIKSFNNDKGTIAFDYTADAGKYTVTATFGETSHYLSSTKSSTFEVKKLPTVISAANVDTVYNVAKYLTVTLKDSNGDPLGNTPITVNLNGVKYLTTDINGQVKLSTSGLLPKTYNAAITFDGNTNYDLSAKTVKVTVKKATPKLTAKAKTFKVKATKKYTVTLKTNQNKVMKNTKITLKVNGKTYSAKTNAKGVATFKLTKLTKKGKYVAVVKYAGNKYYNAKTVKPKIILK